MSKRFTLLAIILATTAGPALGQQAERPAYLNPALPIDQRVDDLASRMTLDEKATQFSSTSAAIPRLQVPAYNWWSEALHGVANQGIATVFPQAIGLAATFNEPLIHQIATTISTEARAKFHEYQRKGRRAGAAPPCRAAAWACVPDRPASTTGRRTSTSSATRAGAAARRPTAKIPFLTGQARHGVRQGPAGRRSEVLQDHRHAQTLRGAQRPGAVAPHVRREGVAARHGGHLPAGVPPDGDRRQGVLGDVRLQPHQRRTRLREHVPAGGHASRRLEVQRLRGVGLRRHPGHQPQPQVRADASRSRRRSRSSAAPTSTAAPTRRVTPRPCTRA